MSPGFVQVYTGNGKGKTTAAVGLAVRAAEASLIAAQAALAGGAYDVVILDEANVADSLGYFEPGVLLGLVCSRPGKVELVITGRAASAELIAAADLVTEMREVKHYFSDGVPSREGIGY